MGPYLGKIAVVGMVDRELRQVRANVVRNVRRDTLQKRNPPRDSPPSSKVYTDE